MKITFGKDVNILSNQSIKFNQEKTKNNNISNFTFGKNNLNLNDLNEIKFNTSIKNDNENINNESLEEEDEEKYDINIKDENDINLV